MMNIVNAEQFPILAALLELDTTEERLEAVRAMTDEERECLRVELEPIIAAIVEFGEKMAAALRLAWDGIAEALRPALDAMAAAEKAKPVMHIHASPGLPAWGGGASLGHYVDPTISQHTDDFTRDRRVPRRDAHRAEP